MLTLKQLQAMEALTSMLESQYESHINRNFGDRDEMIRHVMNAMEKFSEEFDESPWDLFHRLVKEKKAAESTDASE